MRQGKLRRTRARAVTLDPWVLRVAAKSDWAAWAVARARQAIALGTPGPGVYTPAMSYTVRIRNSNGTPSIESFHGDLPEGTLVVAGHRASSQESLHVTHYDPSGSIHMQAATVLGLPPPEAPATP